jgi:hypothetical protein
MKRAKTKNRICKHAKARQIICENTTHFMYVIFNDLFCCHFDFRLDIVRTQSNCKVRFGHSFCFHIFVAKCKNTTWRNSATICYRLSMSDKLIFDGVSLFISAMSDIIDFKRVLCLYIYTYNVLILFKKIKKQPI